MADSEIWMDLKLSLKDPADPSNLQRLKRVISSRTRPNEFNLVLSSLLTCKGSNDPLFYEFIAEDFLAIVGNPKKREAMMKERVNKKLDTALGMFRLLLLFSPEHGFLWEAADSIRSGIDVPSKIMATPLRAIMEQWSTELLTRSVMLCRPLLRNFISGGGQMGPGSQPLLLSPKAAVFAHFVSYPWQYTEVGPMRTPTVDRYGKRVSKAKATSSRGSSAAAGKSPKASWASYSLRARVFPYFISMSAYRAVLKKLCLYYLPHNTLRSEWEYRADADSQAMFLEFLATNYFQYNDPQLLSLMDRVSTSRFPYLLQVKYRHPTNELLASAALLFSHIQADPALPQFFSAKLQPWTGASSSREPLSFWALTELQPRLYDFFSLTLTKTFGLKKGVMPIKTECLSAECYYTFLRPWAAYFRLWDYPFYAGKKPTAESKAKEAKTSCGRGDFESRRLDPSTGDGPVRRGRKPLNGEAPKGWPGVWGSPSKKYEAFEYSMWEGWVVYNYMLYTKLLDEFLNGCKAAAFEQDDRSVLFRSLLRDFLQLYEPVVRDTLILTGHIAEVAQQLHRVLEETTLPPRGATAFLPSSPAKGVLGDPVEVKRNMHVGQLMSEVLGARPGSNPGLVARTHAACPAAMEAIKKEDKNKVLQMFFLLDRHRNNLFLHWSDVAAASLLGKKFEETSRGLIAKFRASQEKILDLERRRGVARVFNRLCACSPWLRNTMVRAVSSLRFQWDTHTSTSLYRIGAGIAALSMRSPEDVSLQKTSELLSDAQTQPFFMHEAEEPAPVSGRISAELEASGGGPLIGQHFMPPILAPKSSYEMGFLLPTCIEASYSAHLWLARVGNYINGGESRDEIKTTQSEIDTLPLLLDDNPSVSRRLAMKISQDLRQPAVNLRFLADKRVVLPIIAVLAYWLWTLVMACLVYFDVVN